MGLPTRLRTLRAGLCALALAGAGLTAGPGAALEAVPGPPLSDAPWGAACAAPRAPEGPWHAAGFGAAVVGVGWIARRRGERD